MATQPAALALTTPPEGLDRRISVAQVQQRRSAIVELMMSAMRDGIDFGVIPGTAKPSLYKPGAEKVCSLFQLAPRVHVLDLSTPDSVRYQVRVELYTGGGAFCGEGIGTASSAESKYQWRATVCDEEYEHTPADRRRIAYKRGGSQGFYTIAQVRTEPEDADNTVLKMAKKRALVDAVLTVTAASDIFAQDVEDLNAPLQDDAQDGEAGAGAQQQQRRPPRPTHQAAATTIRPAATAPAAPQQQQRPQGRPITVPQQNRFHAIASKAGKSSDQVKRYLFDNFGSEHVRDISMGDYDRVCEWAQTKLPLPTDPDPSDYVDQEHDDLEPGNNYKGSF